MDLTAARSALTADIERWDLASERLSQMSTNAFNTTVVAEHFGIAVAIHRVYDDLRDRVVELLQQGSLESDEMARALAAVLKILATADDEVMASLAGLWEW